MTDDTGATSGPSGGWKSQRPAPTIEGTATEVPPEPAAAESQVESEPAAPHADEPPRSPGPAPLIPVALGAGLIGGLVVAGGLWASGMLTPAPVQDTSDLTVRLARLEAQLRSPPPAVSPKLVDDLSSRLTKLESQPAPAIPAAPAPDPALANRLATTESTLKALDQSVADLGRKGDEAGATLRDVRDRTENNTAALAELARRAAKQDEGAAHRSDVTALGDRLAAIESSQAKLQATIARQIDTLADKPARLALAASLLQYAVQRGAPYTGELASLRTLGADPKLIAALEPFAATGVPSAAALGQQFAAIAPELRQTNGSATGPSGFLERLQANAERLVRVRPADAPASADPDAIVARAQNPGGSFDPAATLAELARLPPASQAAVAPWVKTAQARAAALDASRKLAADAATALATNTPVPPPPQAR